MPLEHSELLSDQALCIKEMARLYQLAPDEDKPRFQSFVKYAQERKRFSNVLVDFPTEMRHFLVFQPKMNDVF